MALARLQGWVAVVAIALASAACVPRQNNHTVMALKHLEKELAEVQDQMKALSLQTDSIAVGLDKQRERLEQVYPPTAQWLQLVPGSTVRWYLGEGAGNLHVQCLDPPSTETPVRVTIMTDDKSVEWSPKEGQSLEFSWETGGGHDAMVVTFHRSLVRADGRVFGLFSILPIDAVDLP